MHRLKSISVTLIVPAVLVLGLWKSCFQVTNEIGPIGADKTGRQIFLQSLDAYCDRAHNSSATEWTVQVDSDFFSIPIWRRLFQEPMRTTFRLSYHIKTSQQPDPSLTKRFLGEPADDFTNLFQGPTHLREDWEVQPKEMRSMLQELHVTSVAELLAAYGFRRCEVFIDGKLVSQETLPTIGRGNVRWIGGNQ
jgi:hypothetical protein